MKFELKGHMWVRVQNPPQTTSKELREYQAVINSLGKKKKKRKK